MISYASIDYQIIRIIEVDRQLRSRHIFGNLLKETLSKQERGMVTMRLNPEQLCSPRKRLCYSVCVCLLIVIFLPILVMESKDVTITFTCKNIHTTIDGDGNSQITYTSDNISHVVVGLRLPVPCKCARNQILDTCVVSYRDRKLFGFLSFVVISLSIIFLVGLAISLYYIYARKSGIISETTVEDTKTLQHDGGYPSSDGQAPRYQQYTDEKI